MEVGKLGTVLVIIKLTKFSVPVRFHCGCSKLTFCLYFINFFAMSKNVVHSLEPSETPSNSAPHQAPNYMYVQRSYISQTTLKRCFAVAVRLRLFFQFT